jgi:O-antigen ligase
MNFNRFLVIPSAIATMTAMWIAKIQSVTAAGFLLASLFSHTVALRLLFLSLAVILALMLVLAEAKHSRTVLRYLPPATPAFLLWALWSGASIFWSLEPDRADKEFRNEIIYAGLAYWSCFIAGQYAGLRRKSFVIGILLVSWVLLCTISIKAFFTHNPHLGWHGGPGMHSSVLLVVMPCFLGWQTLRLLGYSNDQGQGFNRVVSCMLALGVASAVAIDSRTVWIGFILQGLLWIFLVTGWRKQNLNPHGVAAERSFARLISVTLGALVIALFIAYQRRDGLEGIVSDGRLSLWQEALRYIAGQPWLGYGFGRGSVRPALEGAFTVGQMHAHNLFLEVSLQTGIIGLVLFLFLLGSLVHRLLQYLRQKDIYLCVLGMVGCMIILGMLIRNMTDMLWVRAAALTFWGVLGVVFGLAARREAGKITSGKTADVLF